MRAIRISAILLGIVILLLLITNPSYTKFKNFSKDINVDGVYTNTKQVSNGFIYSVYVKEVAFTWKSNSYYRIGYIERIKYLGILSNFFEISREKDESQHGQPISK